MLRWVLEVSRGDAIEARELALAAAQSIAARKGEDIVLLDLSRISSFCDVFVICHASNRRQVGAIADGLADDLRPLGVKQSGVEGREACRWVLVDFGDVIVHIFDEPLRGFYDLEGLWSEATPIPFSPTQEPPGARVASG